MAATWDEFKQIAAPIAEEYDIPLAVLLGQAALETGYGTSYNAQVKNNWFGLGAYDANPEKSFSFSSPEESIRYYAELISKDPRYAKAYEKRDNPFEMIREIKKAGYASDPNYVSKVVNIPDFQDNLNDYYMKSGGELTPTSTPFPSRPTATPTPNAYEMIPRINAQTGQQEGVAPRYPDLYKREEFMKRLKEEQSQPMIQRIFNYINPFSEVRAAETSATLNRSVPKPKSFTQPTAEAYTVQAGDTLFDIAQRRLGSGERWRELQGYYGDPRKMPVGTKVGVPQRGSTFTPNMSTPYGERYVPPPQQQSFKQAPNASYGGKSIYIAPPNKSMAPAKSNYTAPMSRPTQNNAVSRALSAPKPSQSSAKLKQQPKQAPQKKSNQNIVNSVMNALNSFFKGIKPVPIRA